jgi:hypothetical protein
MMECHRSLGASWHGLERPDVGRGLHDDELWWSECRDVHREGAA